MGKSKRNCRRTEDEVRIHEKAVKMRKMTDEQLVHYVEDRVEKRGARDLTVERRRPEVEKERKNFSQSSRHQKSQALERLQSINY